MELASGTLINANIRLVEQIGEGAMGAVWAADHLTLHTRVAVKFISADLAEQHPELVMRFKREAAVAARIKSPHVVQTFDQGFMDDGTPYIVMEMLEGETLQELMERTGPLPIAVATQVLVQLSRALTKAHEAGVVHRDIKPDNVFVTPSEEGLFCKILDFGIAKTTQLPHMGGITSAGVLIGTPEFMSPEQVLSSKDVDFRADLWALTVTTYYILSGQLPFNGEAIGELCIKLLSGKYIPVTQYRPDLHASIDSWFARALSRQPSDRFGSAREMARAFVELVSRHHAVGGDATISGMLRAISVATASEVQAFTAKTATTLSGSSSAKRAPALQPDAGRWGMVALAGGAGILAIGGAILVSMLGGDDGKRKGGAADSASALTADAVTVPSEQAPPPSGVGASVLPPVPSAAPEQEHDAASPPPSAPGRAGVAAPPPGKPRPANSVKKPAPSAEPFGDLPREDHGF